MAARAVGLGSAAFESISIDSRELGPQALFVAIRGDRFDGHDFVGAALENGAAAALVSAEKAAGLPQERLIVVHDALEGLRDLARAARARSSAKIVAVTGSAGKTTTKEAIRTVLSAAGATHASIKSFNNHWGVPLMLARLPREAEFAAFEIGMNHAGEITPLVQLVRPQAVVITTVAAAHLEFFDSVAGIARAKAEIFAGLEPGGVAILNIDHDQVPVLLEEAERAGVRRIVRYGMAQDADWRIVAAEPVDGGMTATVEHAGRRIDFSMAVEGRHMVANGVAALAVAAEFGVPEAVAVEALGRFAAPEGRGATLRLGPADKPLLLIDQSYNANSASMTAALDVFGRTAAPDGRKVLVLGDMLELGAAGPDLHAGLKGAVEAAKPDRIYLVGTNMAHLATALGSTVTGHAAVIGDIKDAILSGLAYGDAVMIKGSKGVQLAGLVHKIRERFG